jgi:SnoaL-like protein
MTTSATAQRSSDLSALATSYLDAIGQHDFERLADLLHPDVEFVGPFVTLHSAEEYVTAYRRLALVLESTVLRKVLVDGGELCMIYDFVTSTPAGSITFVEWMTFDGSRIRSIRLYFDRVQFEPARQELFRRAAELTMSTR